MIRLPPDLPDRFLAANEVHARPYEPLDIPVRASYLAIQVETEAREHERAHLRALCERFGCAPPGEDLTQFSVPFGEFQLKWERHGEFSTYILLVPGLPTRPFAEPAIDYLPPDWLAAIPGHVIVATHAQVIRAPEKPDDPGMLQDFFGSAAVVGAAIGDGAGFAYTDFKIQHDGFVRFLMLSCTFTDYQAGRMMQRLFEIEAYRVLALLALPIARRESPRVVEIERSLAALTQEMANEDRGDETLLGELTQLAAKVESAIASSQYRFGASRAYHALVNARINELRERRIPGLQTIEEFMARRLSPAMATCTSLSRRLQELSERVARASSLLSTRVSIAREKQNQALLASMDRRARLQLRLQQTVEGLSVVAISYYVVGLIAYVATGLEAAGVRIDAAIATGLAIPMVAFAVAMTVRWVRRRIVGNPPAKAAPTAVGD
ncbi:MAG: DUF3422 family protein [bacterium]|jgi:uncharacterized membrane-anchored protein|nr:DUF3422 domain-containing protein [Betaproteobacteria bacterium]